MEIISHRGFWEKPEEKNQIISFKRAFHFGIGIETDVRDYKGKLVISHDIPDKNSILLNDFFNLYKKFKCQSLLALNIKADGLQDFLLNAVHKFEIDNYFVFDMSVPDTLGYLRQGMPFFTRQSEYEPEPILYNEANGIWIDCFNSEWYSDKIIMRHLENKKKVAIISSEIHNRDHIIQWKYIKNKEIHKNLDLILCTDFPSEAMRFFNE